MSNNLIDIPIEGNTNNTFENLQIDNISMLAEKLAERGIIILALLKNLKGKDWVFDNFNDNAEKPLKDLYLKYREGK